VALGGRVAAPGRPVRSVQFIDVRDLARWMVRIVEKGAAGVFNAVGPRVPLTMQEVLEACRAVSASDARFEWIAEDFLAASDVQPWKEMPLWVPESNPDHAGFMEVPIVRAIASGLTFRSLRDTVADTLDWSLTRSSHHAWKAGLPSSREAELLRSWDARPREGARS